MPEEILAIVLVSIAAGTFISFTRMVLAYKERKLDGTSTGTGSSMTTSELERLMKRAVESATAPLVEKIEDIELEISSGGRSLSLEASPPDLLLDLDALPEEVEEPVARTTRSRS
jgi:hypothetical protein